jgi:hypothetical protein
VGLLLAGVSARLPAVRRPWEPSRIVSVVVSFVVVRLGSVTAKDSLVEHEPDADDRRTTVAEPCFAELESV